MTPIKYVGHRPKYREGTYGSGIVFEHGAVIEVDDALAVKLLRHKDVYVRGDAAESVGKFELPPVDQKKKQAEEEEGKIQDQRDAIALMNKEALELFVKTNFQIDIDRRKSVGALREQAINLIDQYGIAE